MMLPTHVLVGLAIATPVMVVAPEYVSVALAGALVGSIIPDLDMYWDHRRSLHFPTGYTLAALPALAVAALIETPLFVSLAFLLIGAALHCRMDRYGGGLELRPWDARSDRGVYDHVNGRWRRPKRWIRYDGAPEDVFSTILVGGFLYGVLDGPFRGVVLAALLIGISYGLLRRRLANLAPVVFRRIPEPMADYVPARYRL